MKQVTDIATIDPDSILAHVANGGSLRDLATMWNLPYRTIYNHMLSADPDGRLYANAKKEAEEVDRDSVLAELRGIIKAHATQLFSVDGTLLPVSKWPKELIAGFKFGKGGGLEEVKIVDKLRAVELLGKERGMFNKSKLELTMTLEDLVKESWSEGAIDAKPIE